MLYLNDSGMNGQDLRQESMSFLPRSHDSHSYFCMHYMKARLVVSSSDMGVESSIIILPGSPYSHIISIKLMSRLTTDPPTLSIRIQDITASIPPSRIQLYRPINPQLTPLRQNKSEVYRHVEKEQAITSPFQKDQFLNEYEHAHLQKKLYLAGDTAYGRGSTKQYGTKGKASSIMPQVIKMQQIPSTKEALSKSWTNHGEHRETVTYLQQIINDLSDKQEFELTRRYIQKLQNPHLRQKLEVVVSKLQAKESAKTMEALAVRDGLVKILKNYFRYQRSIELASTQRLVKELQKSITKQAREEPRSTRKQSQQKVKQMREQSKLLNSKLQRETKQLYRALEQQKSKIKESYQQIYRRIYEENNKLKKEFETKEAELRHEKAETEAVKVKYEAIFNEISIQFKDIKLEYSKLIDASAKQSMKNKNLTEEIRFISERLRLEEVKSKQLEQQISNHVKRYELLQDEKQKLEEMGMKYQDYADKFLGETKKYQNERFEKEKVKVESRENQRQIRRNQQQERHASDLEANIRANEEILCNQLLKIQENQSNHQEKIRIFADLSKEIRTTEIDASRHRATLQELKAEQQNLQQKIVLMKDELSNGKQQISKLQQKQSIMAQLINSQEQTYIKLTQQTKIKGNIRQDLQREVKIINEEILDKKQKLLTIKMDVKNQQSRNDNYLAQFNRICKQIQNKNREIGVLSSQLDLKNLDLIELQEKLRILHQNIDGHKERKEKLQLQDENTHNHKMSERNNIHAELDRLIAQKQVILHQCISEITRIRKAIDTAANQHGHLQQAIDMRKQELSYLQELFMNKKDLMKSIQNKLTELESNMEILEKSNQHMQRSDNEATSRIEQMKDCEIDAKSLQQERQSLKECIQSLKQQKTRTSEELQSLRESLRAGEDELAKKRKEKQAIDDVLASKYEEIVYLQGQILIKKSLGHD